MVYIVVRILIFFVKRIGNGHGLLEQRYFLKLKLFETLKARMTKAEPVPNGQHQRELNGAARFSCLPTDVHALPLETKTETEP